MAALLDTRPLSRVLSVDEERGLVEVEAGIQHLTYHRWATTASLLTAYPQLPASLDAKRAHDPYELFQSDWDRSLRGPLALEQAA